MARSLSEIAAARGSVPTNKVGTFESMLAGVGSGLIAIPKGLFSLGATLLDLGVDSGKAAAVEQWFDDLTEWDEKAEATAAGKITELLVNIGVPGGYGFKLGSQLAKQAMLASKTGKYIKMNTPSLKAGVKKIVKKIRRRHKDLDLPGMPGPVKGKYPGIDKAMKNIKESGDIFGKAEGGRIGRATHGYGKAYMKGGRAK